MKTIISKKDLIDWISSLEDKKILEELSNIKRKATFNFDEEFNKGITGEELKKRISAKISALPWKK